MYIVKTYARIGLRRLIKLCTAWMVLDITNVLCANMSYHGVITTDM